MGGSVVLFLNGSQLTLVVAHSVTKGSCCLSSFRNKNVRTCPELKITLSCFLPRRIKFAQTLSESEHQQTVFTIIRVEKAETPAVAVKKCGLDSAKERRSVPRKAVSVVAVGCQDQTDEERRHFYILLP